MSFTSRVCRSRRAARRLLATTAAGLLAGSVVFTAIQQPPPAPQPTFRSGVQLIEVDVRVFDAQGKFVSDLSREEFEVIEEGTSQRIESMYLVGAPGVVSASPGDLVDPTSILPRSVEQGPAAPQTWIFFFDLNHLTPGGADRARKAVEAFIQERFRDGDLAGIIAGDRMVNNRITSVRQELLDGIKQVKPRGESQRLLVELTREWPRLLDGEEAIRIAREDREVIQRATMRACGEDPEQCQTADQMVREKGRRLAGEIHRSTLQTLASANALASGLARMPGPKTVVMLSEGFVVQDIETTLRSIVGQTARAGARVYGIDVRGIGRVGNAGLIDQMQAEDTAGGGPKFDTLADGPNSLAVDTGGMMIRNENNIGRALQKIADDAGRYYVLAYQPANTTFDGKYRPIQVRVKREGVRVRARRGYLALEPSRMLKPAVLTPPTAAEKPDLVPETPVPAAPPEPVTPAEPREPSKPVTGTVVATPSTAPAGGIRLRPDPGNRVKALSARETTATSDVAKRGWEAYEKGDLEVALAALAEAAQRPDARPWVLYALGMAQAGLNRPADAIASWERVRQAAPDFEPVYLDLADTHAQVGDMTTALAIVRQAEKRFPQNADIQSAIGVIHVRRGALDEGIEALVKAAALRSDDPLAHLNVGRAYALKFHRSRRYVTSQRRWVASEDDRQKALDAFKRCVALGGPYAQQARDEMSILEWSKG
jgi:VWFA-related protein